VGLSFTLIITESFIAKNKKKGKQKSSNNGSVFVLEVKRIKVTEMSASKETTETQGLICLFGV
jgi:hypothetical protein